MQTHLTKITLLVAMLFWLPAAVAGDFVSLPTTGNVRVLGSNNTNADPMFLQGGLSAQWQLIDTRNTPMMWSQVDAKNPDGATFTYGVFQDKVFKNTIDGTLAFASRLSLNLDLGNANGEFGAYTFPDGYVASPSENAYTHLFYSEANYIWRSGYTGYSTAAAWYQEITGGPYSFQYNSVDYATGQIFVDEYFYGDDFRLKAAAMTSDPFKLFTSASYNPVYNPDVVGFNTDVSTPEANPNSGWYLVKTNATQYTLMDNAAHILQDGGNGEGRPTRNWYLTAFVPVPEPDTSILLMIGLIGMGFFRRRSI